MPYKVLQDRLPRRRLSLVMAVGSKVEVSRARGLFRASDVAIGSNTGGSRIDRERL